METIPYIIAGFMALVAAITLTITLVRSGALKQMETSIAETRTEIAVISKLTIELSAGYREIVAVNKVQLETLAKAIERIEGMLAEHIREAK